MKSDKLILTLQFPNGEREEVCMDCKTDYNEDCAISYRGSVHTGYTIYHCFNDIRKEHFDKAGIKVLCNGARLNFTLSGMTASMTRGWAGYIINEDSATTVGTFDFYDKIEDLVTVEEQKIFRNR
jgi:hypothetical protein